MKTKQIHEFLQQNSNLLQKKVASQENIKNEEVKEYTKGQLYEAQYILENVERIIYSD